HQARSRLKSCWNLTSTTHHHSAKSYWHNKSWAPMSFLNTTSTRPPKVSPMDYYLTTDNASSYLTIDTSDFDCVSRHIKASVDIVAVTQPPSC
ncbi:MAG: hypothetical protein ACK56I_24310, partial [bacterium]